MARLPPLDTTVKRIYDGYEARARIAPPRVHLGASEIGGDCERAIWYSFRWVKTKEFPGRILRLFDTGKLEEDRIVADLNAIGAEVRAFDMRTGRQYRIEAFGGHFGGSLDGLVKGVIEAPRTWHVLEMKTHNDNSFISLTEKGVRESKPDHYYQMQVYMGLSHEAPLSDVGVLDRAFYIAVNKNTDQIYIERVHYDMVAFERMMNKARRVIFGTTAPVKISTSATSIPCKWCNFKEVCHGKIGEDFVRPLVNCRTCLHSTPYDDGTWRCEKWNRVLPPVEQRAGCEKHLFLPSLLPLKQIDATDNSVIYEDEGQEFVNHEGGEIV